MNAKDALIQLSANGVLQDRRIASSIAVGLQDFSKRWKSEILEFAAHGGAELRFIEGQYGRGKTHLLQHLWVQAESEGFMVCHASCSSGMAPFASMPATYATVAGSLTYSDGGVDTVGLDEILLRIPEEMLSRMQVNPMLNAAFRNVAAGFGRTRTSRNRDHDCIRNLRSVIMGETGLRFRFADIFNSLSSIRRPVARLGKRNAGVWLRSLFNLPRVLGYRGLVVLFDETGQDMHYSTQSTRQRREHLTNLRLLVDQMALGYLSGVVVVYAVTHDLAQQARYDYPALAQRILRVGERDDWDRLQPNPRAVWCRLDEITRPERHSPAFYKKLAAALLKLGEEAKVSPDRLKRAQTAIDPLISEATKSSADDVVRLFVKKFSIHLA